MTLPFADLRDLAETMACVRCNGHGYLGGGRRDDAGRPYLGTYSRGIATAGHACPVCEGTGIRPTRTVWSLEPL